jgi:hypothetical protein
MAGSCFIIYIHKLLNFAIYGFKVVAVTLQIFILRQNTIEIAVAMLLWRPGITMLCSPQTPIYFEIMHGYAGLLYIKNGKNY